MVRQILIGLLLAGVLLQGAVAAGADLSQEPALPEHCMGGEPSTDDGDCCAEGMSAACAAQCQVGEAPVALVLPVRDEVFGSRMAAADLSVPNPSYIPDLPPPIA